ncbi:MAG: SelB C-terminal domain-containing protein, partial [Gaiellaceae bacterium]
RTTMGGAVVLDPAPPRRLSPERLELIERDDIAATVHAPVRLDSLRHLAPSDLDAVERAGDWLFSREWLETFAEELRAHIAAADPLDPGVAVPPTAWATAVVPRLGLEQRGSKLYLRGAAASLGDRTDAAARLEAELAEAGYTPVPVEDRELGAYLEREGRLVRVGDGLAVGAGAHAQARQLLVEECRREGSIALARFRDLLGTGRRPAQLLLERFDADGVTRRIGDARVLRRRASRG